ncbi:alg2 [Scenedesmus sp. PABB004]|nr:alg2 [Scenedesmus sp. PABB004]
MTRRLRVAFLHPDLGLGGAERLVVDACMELAARGHTVDMYTAYYDPGRCFEETRSGAFAVLVAGGWFPRSVGGRLVAACAVVRCVLAALFLAMRVWSGAVPDYDVLVVDQVAAVVPLLKLLLPGARLLFYCHFPDLLLSGGRGSRIKALYRAPLDALEQAATGAADLALVNSNFTAAVYAATFTRLAASGAPPPRVLYPAVAVPGEADLAAAAAGWRGALPAELAARIGSGPTFLSINRFERKKGIGLALSALQELLARRPDCGAQLVVAGGYDARLPENREHLDELRALAAELGVAERVAFLPSFTDGQRGALLAACRAVVYTPAHEHFGIVPLEAMVAGRPVVAVNSGGPTESVRHGETGLLCEPTPAAFADAMEALLEPKAAARMGAAARKHVIARFSRAAFGEQLNEYVLALAATGEVLQQQQQQPQQQLHDGAPAAAAAPAPADGGEFINTGLLTWLERRREWTARRASGDAKRSSRKRTYSPAVTPEQVLSFAPFPKPVPLEDVVEVLTEVWEQEDFY